MNVTVIGQGYVGLPIAISAAEAGYIVGGFDIDLDKINQLKNGSSDSPEVTSKKLIDLQLQSRLKFSADIFDHKASTIFVIAVPTPLDQKRNPELKYLISACEILAKIVKPGDLVINESTSFIGTLRDLIKPTIEKLSGIKNLDYAAAPERIDPGNPTWGVQNTPRVLAGITDIATSRAADFYGKFCNSIHLVTKPEVAEAAKLLENSFRQVNIALVNELSEIVKAYKISANETISAAATKPFGFMPFYPSIGVGGHCIPIDPSYLIYSAKQVGLEAEIITLANEINLSRPEKVVKLIKGKFHGDLERKVIQVAGITYKPNISDLRESPALKLIKELEKNGANVIWFDPFIQIFEGKKSQPLSSQIDLGLIVTPHDNIDFSVWRKSNTQVLDLTANSKNYGWPKFL